MSEQEQELRDWAREVIEEFAYTFAEKGDLWRVWNEVKTGNVGDQGFDDFVEGLEEVYHFRESRVDEGASEDEVRRVWREEGAAICRERIERVVRALELEADLEGLSAEEIPTRLVKALADDDWFLREYGAFLVARVSCTDPGVIAGLGCLLSDERPGPCLRSLETLSLLADHSTSATARLIPLLEHPNRKIAWEAKQALRTILGLGADGAGSMDAIKLLKMAGVSLAKARRIVADLA